MRLNSMPHPTRRIVCRRMTCRFMMNSHAARLFAAITLITMVQPAYAQEAPKLGVDAYRLSNGLKVALSHDPLAPRTTICVAYHVGSKNERPGLTGFAHFFEHMMFRGTINVPNFDTPLQPAGGGPNAFTSNDMTVYFETISSNYVERALFMEAERMAFLSNGLSPEKFDTEREIVKNERRQRMENVPYGLADEAISASLFPEGHPYSWSVIGSMKDLNNADLGDLREFFYEFYHPGNATLTVVGNFDEELTREWIEKYFGVLRAGPDLATVEVTEGDAEPERIVQLDQVRFPRVYWTWRTVPESHADATALSVLGGILSTGEASRLYQDLVVDKKVASGASASSDTLEVDGKFTIAATATQDSSIEQIEARLRNVLDQIANAGPTEKELARVVVTQQTGTVRALTSTTTRAHAIAMGFSQYDDPHFYQKQYQELSKISADDVKRVARKYLLNDQHVLIVRPVKEGEAESSAILAGPLASDRSQRSSDRRQPMDDERWQHLPGPSESAGFDPPPFERVKLSNGLEVFLAKWETLPLTSVQLVVPVGRIHDPANKTGLGNLVARTWDKGTKDMSPAEFAAALEMHGTQLSVAQSFDTTSLSFSITTAELEGATELVAALVREPGFAPDSVELEKSLMLNSLAQGPSDSSWIGSRVFDRLVFGLNHPLGLPGLGFEDTVSGLTRDDVVGHYQKNFSPSQAKLVVVGSGDREATIELLERTWGTWQNDQKAANEFSPIRNNKTGAVFAVDKPGAVQSIVMVGRPWRSQDDKDKAAYDVGNRIFAGDFLSRINQNLRERNGFTYGARASFDYFEGGSRWRLSSAIRADVTGAALREIVNEITAARGEQPISNDEVMVARDAAMNVFPEQFATPDSIASALANLARFNLPDDTFGDYAGELANVGAEDTSKLVATLTDPAGLTILVVGDRKLIEAQLAENGFEEVVWLDENGLRK